MRWSNRIRSCHSPDIPWPQGDNCDPAAVAGTPVSRSLYSAQSSLQSAGPAQDLNCRRHGALKLAKSVKISAMSDWHSWRPHYLRVTDASSRHVGSTHTICSPTGTWPPVAHRLCLSWMIDLIKGCKRVECTYCRLEWELESCLGWLARCWRCSNWMLRSTHAWQTARKDQKIRN